MAGKFNMAQQKVPMPERDPKERARCFQEVAMGYTPEPVSYTHLTLPTILRV